MELVEGDGGIRQVLGDTLDEGRAHIDADLADRLRGTAMRDEITGEGGYGVGILALGCEHDAGAVDVDKQSDVVVAAPGSGLIDGEPGHTRSIGPHQRLVYIVVNHTPQPGVVLAHNPGHRLDRHGRDHGHDQRLEQ